MSAGRSKELQLQGKEAQLRESIEKKHGKSVEQLYQERQKRVRDAIELREPDRVPVTIQTSVFAARYAGLTASAMYYDHKAYKEACLKTIVDFEPDISQGLGTVASGRVLDILDARHQRWPGGTLPDDVAYQYVEGEYMKADEYDLFLSDPSDYIERYYLPRIFGTLAPLSHLPPMRNFIGGTGFVSALTLFGRPEFRKLAEKLYQASQEQDKLRKEAADFAGELARLGFFTQQSGGGVGGAPFDAVSDHLRGMRGSMIDMYQRPDKLLEACNKILEWRIAQARPADQSGSNLNRLSMPLHRGSDGFMSLAQFEKFYWPTLKKAILANMELGFIPAPFCEGIWNERLEYLRELPKGKVICFFEKTDMFKAKEVLGGHICIQGNVPPSLLEFGSPQDVEEYCRKLITVCGKGGGFILSAGSAVDQAKPANVKAMVDSAKKYCP